MSDTVAGLIGLAIFAVMGLIAFYLSDIRSLEDLRRRAAGIREANASRAMSLAQERTSGIEVPFSPAEVLDGVTEHMMRSGWPLESRTENTVTFVRSAQPNPALGCLLAILFLIPALIYFLIVAGKTKRVTVAAYPLGAGSRVVIGGDSRAGVARLRRWAKILPDENAGDAQYV